MILLGGHHSNDKRRYAEGPRGECCGQSGLGDGLQGDAVLADKGYDPDHPTETKRNGSA